MSIVSEIIRIEGAVSDIATSITAKGVAVPDGAAITAMPALIDSIDQSSGGGSGTVGDGAITVRFIDPIDGVFLTHKVDAGDSIDLDTITPPSHDGLTFQGWSQSGSLNSISRNEDVGALYILTDTSVALEIDYTVVEYGGSIINMESQLVLTAPYTVDWGDGQISSSYSPPEAIQPGSYTMKIYTSAISGEAASSGYIFGSQVYNNYITAVRFGTASFEISAYMFRYCRSMKYITLNNNITNLSYNALEYCQSLSSVVIPSSLTSLATSLFSYDYSLVSIVIPSSVISTGTYVFYYCHSLSSVVIPSSVTSIGRSAFYYCYALSSVVIPDGVTDIPMFAFYYCYALSSVVIPDGVTSIGNFSFCYCTALKSVIIPSSVTTIVNAAFSNATNLLTVDLTAATAVPTLGGTSAFQLSGPPTILVPMSLLDDFKTATNWSSFADYIVGVEATTDSTISDADIAAQM